MAAPSTSPEVVIEYGIVDPATADAEGVANKVYPAPPPSHPEDRLIPPKLTLEI
jgi:hypothetical protein